MSKFSEKHQRAEKIRTKLRTEAREFFSDTEVEFIIWSMAFTIGAEMEAERETPK